MQTAPLWGGGGERKKGKKSKGTLTPEFAPPLEKVLLAPM